MQEQTKMTADEFKAETRRRGWTFRALAIRWEKSETWISKIANNPNRDQHWDDAVKGLPFIENMNNSS